MKGTVGVMNKKLFIYFGEKKMIKKNKMEKKNNEYIMDVKNIFVKIEKIDVLKSI